MGCVWRKMMMFANNSKPVIYICVLCQLILSLAKATRNDVIPLSLIRTLKSGHYVL